MNTSEGKPEAITEDAPVRLNENQVTLDIYALEENGSTCTIILSDVTDRKRSAAMSPPCIVDHDRHVIIHQESIEMRRFENFENRY